jgi:long-chain acyl-CoA synthetase
LGGKEEIVEERPWHKSYAPGVARTLEYEELTVSGGLARSARNFPDRVALNYMGRKITYRELDELVNRFARALRDLEVEEGDKVATILPNIPEVIIANMAAFRIGAVVVLNNPLYTERELQYQLDDSDSKIAVTLSVLVPRLLSIMPRTRLERIVACQINNYLPFPKKQLFPHLRK